MKWYIQSKGVKCDAEGCDFREEHVDIETLEQWRNVPCPKCGANLLTDEDWFTIKLLNRLMGCWPIRFINWIGKKLGCKARVYKATFDGSGKMELNEVESTK